VTKLGPEERRGAPQGGHEAKGPSVMKFLAVALVACTAPDDLATLHREAAALATYYRPTADELEQRLHVLVVRGPMLGEAAPGSDLANQHRRTAERAVGALRAMVGATGTPGELVRRADELAAARDRAGLARLVDVAGATLPDDVAVIAGELVLAEDWLTRAEAIRDHRTATGPGSRVGADSGR